jgi:amidohydrolase
LQVAREQALLPPSLNVRGIFQPAEETGQGALEMMSAGALEGVAAIFSVHLDPSRPVGRVGVRYGALTAACDSIEINISGRGGHAARPHLALDPIQTAAQLINTLYQSVPRSVDSQDPVVVTIGQITAGDSANVIPDHALLRGTLRTLGGAVRVHVKNHIQQLAGGLAEASGTRIDVQFGAGTPPVQNNSELTGLLYKAGSDVLGPDQIDIIDRTSMGGEDFAFYLEQVPGAMFRLGCASAVAGGAPLHSPYFDIDETALAIGAKVLARAAVLWSETQRIQA